MRHPSICTQTCPFGQPVQPFVVCPHPYPQSPPTQTPPHQSACRFLSPYLSPQILSLPALEPLRLVGCEELPVRTLAVMPDSSLVASGGDFEGLRVVGVDDEEDGEVGYIGSYNGTVGRRL